MLGQIKKKAMPLRRVWRYNVLAMLRDLSGMVTAITGASSGIGRALAVALAEKGSKLALGARRLDRLQDLSREIGRDHLSQRIDVSHPEDCREFLTAAVEKFGRLDTVVCNAGYGFARPLDRMSAADIRQIFDTNLFGTIECCRLAIGIMKDQSPRDGFRGQLMIVSSACARRGLPYFSIYAATKAAQLSLAEGLRIELKPLQIAVTSVHPVLCETDFFSTATDLSGMSPAALAQGGKQSPQCVAAKMARAIQRPVAELWPKPMSRLSLNLANLLPAMTDKVMCRLRDQMLRDHNCGKKTASSESESNLTEIPA
jgi:NADP-dependent 3-hydroxy acid dehydrogenase YdfG